MKISRSKTHCKTYAIPALRFEEQQLTSFSGLLIFQRLFDALSLSSRLRNCFRHVKVTPIFGYSRIVLLLVVHMLLGYRELRSIRYYEEDPLVQRLLGLKRLPDVATLSRTLSSVDDHSVNKLQGLNGQLVLDRLSRLELNRVTLDFDGSVIGTGRFAEGTAIGYNRKKKGQRSYYPLFCTLAQTGQVLDVLHRSGNVHDSNGAQTFISDCIEQVKSVLPRAVIEVRMDSAFFSDAIIAVLDQQKIEYSISVPFERLGALKEQIESRRRWHRINRQCDYFEIQWKPKCWLERHRFIAVRKTVKKQTKQPVQLDLFIPYEQGYEFKVIITNKTTTANHVVAYHNGRGSQEGIFAELKSQNQLDYVPTRTWNGNKVYMLATLLAHNLSRELQMRVNPRKRNTVTKRKSLWPFEQLNSLRQRIIQRAGRLIRPNGKITLSMNANKTVENELLHYLNAIEQAA